MIQDLPMFASTAHTHSTYAGGMVYGGYDNTAGNTPWIPHIDPLRARRVQQVLQSASTEVQAKPKVSKMAEKQVKRRIVQVFVADPDENVPLDHCVLYTGPQIATDLTDQELFFEIDIKNLLDAHNKKRVEWNDKSIKSKEKKLEPAKIRDLVMTVVTVASF